MSVQQSQTVIFANKQRQYEQGKLEITWISEVTSAGVEMTVKQYVMQLAKHTFGNWQNAVFDRWPMSLERVWSVDWSCHTHNRKNRRQFKGSIFGEKKN